MKIRTIYLLVLLMLAFGLLGTAGAAIITFDDLNTSGSGYVPDGYAGFNWTLNTTSAPNSYSTHWRVWPDSNAPSPNNVATNYCDGDFVGISSNKAFDFSGAYFSTFEQSSGAASSVTIAGFRNGSLVQDPIVLSLTLPFTWSQINLSNVDMLTFTPGTEAFNPYISYPDGFRYTEGWFGMDNFTYNTVPEPATLLLLSLGLMGVAGIRRKLKN
ncbi:MAG: PEP-CTERM sorting domain-containing protein [Syntrophales bacterium]|jgi:hypothetical protein